MSSEDLQWCAGETNSVKRTARGQAKSLTLGPLLSVRGLSDFTTSEGPIVAR